MRTSLVVGVLGVALSIAATGAASHPVPTTAPPTTPGVVAVERANAPTQARYVFPPNLSLALERVMRADPGPPRTRSPGAVPGPDGEVATGAIRITACLEGRLGTVADLEIRFTSSPDLAVRPARHRLDRLPAGRRHDLAIELTRTGRAADELGSWVMMTVRYRPDFAAILAAVGDAAAYPVAEERARLQRIAAANQRQGAANVDGVRLFLD